MVFLVWYCWTLCWVVIMTSSIMLNIIMPNVFMLSAFTLNDIRLNASMLSSILLNITMPSTIVQTVIMLNAIKLSDFMQQVLGFVHAECHCAECQNTDCCLTGYSNAECHNAECIKAECIILNTFIPTVKMMNVTMPTLYWASICPIFNFVKVRCSNMWDYFMNLTKINQKVPKLIFGELEFRETDAATLINLSNLFLKTNSFLISW